jgi:hypothetical protein
MHSHEIHLRFDLKLFRFFTLALLALGLICLLLGWVRASDNWLSVALSFHAVSAYVSLRWARRAIQLYRFLRNLRRPTFTITKP